MARYRVIYVCWRPGSQACPHCTPKTASLCRPAGSADARYTLPSAVPPNQRRLTGDAGKLRFVPAINTDPSQARQLPQVWRKPGQDNRARRPRARQAVPGAWRGRQDVRAQGPDQGSVPCAGYNATPGGTGKLRTLRGSQASGGAPRACDEPGLRIWQRGTPRRCPAPSPCRPAANSAAAV